MFRSIQRISRYTEIGTKWVRRNSDSQLPLTKIVGSFHTYLLCNQYTMLRLHNIIATIGPASENLPVLPGCVKGFPIQQFE